MEEIRRGYNITIEIKIKLKQKLVITRIYEWIKNRWKKIIWSIKSKFFNAKMMLEIMNNQYEIINGMIADTLIKNNQSTYKIYKQLIKESSQFLDEN